MDASATTLAHTRIERRSLDDNIITHMGLQTHGDDLENNNRAV